MAGQVKPKKLFHGMLPDFKAIWMLAPLKEHNAELIFGAIAKEIANVGVNLIDVRIFMEDHLTTVGPMTRKRLIINRKSLQLGMSTTRELARFKIGQGVVVQKGIIVAVEDFAGTDDLIR
jgi:DUF1009 family protein